MSQSCRKLALAFVVAMVAIALAPVSAVAIGYYNLPGNFCQCFGYGVGAGYHAPLVLGPPSVKGCFAHNEQRLWHPPGPPCDYANCSCGMSDCGCTIADPSVLEPTLIPSAAPEALPAPAPALPPAAYRVPFRY